MLLPKVPMPSGLPWQLSEPEPKRGCFVTAPTKTSKVYSLYPNVEDPRYEGFGFDRADSLRGKSRLVFDFSPDDIPTNSTAAGI